MFNRRILSYSFKIKYGEMACFFYPSRYKFLGYRIWKDYKLLRKQSVVRAKRKINKYLLNNDNQKLTRFLASWHGHIQWSNSYNIKCYIDNIIKRFKV